MILSLTQLPMPLSIITQEQNWVRAHCIFKPASKSKAFLRIIITVPIHEPLQDCNYMLHNETEIMGRKNDTRGAKNLSRDIRI